jgi:hypothetical protein
MRIIFIILLLCAVTGCTSKAREVAASIPLVSASQDKPDKKEIPSKYWSFLSNSQLKSFEHYKYQIKLAGLYTSALGQVCRELTFIDKEQNEERRTACEISFLNQKNQLDKAWFLEKKIVASGIYVEF